MRYKNVSLIIMLSLSIGLIRLQAQETIPASGGDANGSGGTVSYSIGQIVYISNSGTNGSVGQGVQQPFEISIVNGVEDLMGITLNCSAFPNPATDYLILRVEVPDIVNLTYKLFDANGKLLANKNIESSETRIPISSLIPATYILKLVQDSYEVKTFKIIKN